MSASPEQRESRLGISPFQVAGSALAAASAAFLASYFGVTGTIIGAAVASVVATVGSATYTSSLKRSSAAVRRTAQALARPRSPEDGTAEHPAAEHTGAGATQALVTDEHPDGRWRRALRGLPLAKVAASTVVVLVITFGALTGFEAVTGKPLSALLTGKQETGTSLGHASGSSSGGSGQQAPTPAAPSRTPSSTPSASPSSGGTPTSGITPSGSPSASPGAGSSATPQATPSSEPSATPTSGATSSTGQGSQPGG